ncbi:MAG: HU family DNA-binding protein [Bacteroidaceae bacterium]|nr:HU family DNA-binding protein [Bacteroidaceae bacterium]
MNNKEFISRLAEKTNFNKNDVQEYVKDFADFLGNVLEDNDTLTIPNFGNFEIKKKKERIVVNPATKQRMLVPPKLSLNFKPGLALKEKLKYHDQNNA